MNKKTRRAVFGLAVLPFCLAGSVALADSLVPKTGQTSCFNSSGTEIICSGTGQDGDLRAGVEWPTPRFVDNGNGTVTDRLTNLVWVQNIFCFRTGDWQAALDHANDLADGTCSVTDGSVPGDWRVPNIRELLSVLDYGTPGPALPVGHPFLPANVLGPTIWSSTTVTQQPVGAWRMNLVDGSLGNSDKITAAEAYTWPVRDAPPPPTQCSDGIDNDNDGFIDLDDRQCKGLDQNSEKHPNR